MSNSIESETDLHDKCEKTHRKLIQIRKFILV
jgi:hypothetical protein